jgi:hypothetical protein
VTEPAVQPIGGNPLGERFAGLLACAGREGHYYQVFLGWEDVEAVPSPVATALTVTLRALAPIQRLLSGVDDADRLEAVSVADRLELALLGAQLLALACALARARTSSSIRRHRRGAGASARRVEPAGGRDADALPTGRECGHRS